MVQSQYTVVYDACVFYPAPVRDLLVSLATTGLFRAKWTEQIHQEWITSLQRNRPDLKKNQLARTKELINHSVLDCLVYGYEPLIEGLSLPDANDRHVLAAAIRCGAQSIVTYNLKDFPKKNLSKYDIECQSPDVFCGYLIDLSPGLFLASVKQIRNRLKKPPLEPMQYLANLETMGLQQTTSWLRDYKNLI